MAPLGVAIWQNLNLCYGHEWYLKLCRMHYITDEHWIMQQICVIQCMFQKFEAFFHLYKNF